MLLTRTPYDANGLTSHADSAHLGPMLEGYDNATDVIVEGGYIRVVQDVRGKYGSEGDYVMNRPLHGPQNPTPVDDATDTYDTIDWLVKNVPESNGKVGILGISYDGFVPLMALVNPHPALKVSVPMNPMVDGWMGDDWFHNGAFRQQNLPYILRAGGDAATTDAKWWTSYYDDYDTVHEGRFGRRAGRGATAWSSSASGTNRWRIPLRRFLERSGGGQGAGAAQPLKVPVMLVHSLWDQEDIYGATRRVQGDQAEGHSNDMVYSGASVRGITGRRSMTAAPGRDPQFGSDTGAVFPASRFCGPFLAQYLKDGAPKADSRRSRRSRPAPTSGERLDSLAVRLR